MRTKRNYGDVWIGNDVGMRIGLYNMVSGSPRSRSQLKRLTFITNDDNFSTMFSNAQGMVLHARASTNIT
jgi:hypothetical protein